MSESIEITLDIERSLLYELAELAQQHEHSTENEIRRALRIYVMGNWNTSSIQAAVGDQAVSSSALRSHTAQPGELEQPPVAFIEVWGLISGDWWYWRALDVNRERLPVRGFASETPEAAAATARRFFPTAQISIIRNSVVIDRPLP